MRLRSVVAAGFYVAMVPALGATGTWTGPMLAAPFVAVQAPAVTPGQAGLPIHAARVEQLNATAGLQAAMGRAPRDAQPAWFAWSVPSVSQHNDRNWNDRSESRCVLDEDGNFEGGNNVGGQATSLLILVRTTRGAIDRVTFADARCPVEAGTRTVYWIDSVRPADSVQLLAAVVRRDAAGVKDDNGDGTSRCGKRALAAVALHADSSVEPVLEGFVAPSSTRWLRRDAAFWLGAVRSEQAFPLLDRLARTDPDESFRDHLTFVLTLTGDRGLQTLLDLARHDPSPHVRGQALFWVGQKAGQKALGPLGAAVNEDPDSEVRKKAVFAISQLPHDQSVPKLIELARTHRDPEVRKQAMFWLGQSGDDRAVAFFESVLTK